jgi:hypothetical protein
MPDNMDIDKIALQQNNYQWQLGCINSADTKAGFLVTINLALIGFAASQVDKILSKPHFKMYNMLNSSNDMSVWPVILLVCLALFTLLSLFFATKAIFPRFSGDSNSIFYFKSILYRDKQQYGHEIESAETAITLNDLSGQVWELSKIAFEKYKNIRTGFWMYGISILLLLAIYIQRAING